MVWNLEEAISYYKSQGAPADQNALIALLKEVQRECGSISRAGVAEIAESYGIKDSLLLALIRRVPGLRLDGKHTLEICAGPNCGKRGKLCQFVDANWGKNPENCTVKYVPCLRQCGKGPNIRWDGKLYNGADEALLRKLLNG